MADDEVLVTWNAETRQFVDEVLTVNDVLKENERRLQRSDKAVKSWEKSANKGATQGESLFGSFKKVAAGAALAYASVETAKLILEEFNAASERAIGAFSAVQAGGADDRAIQASRADTQRAMAPAGRTAAIRAAAQESVLGQYDAEIAESGVLGKVTGLLGREFERARILLGTSTDYNYRVEEIEANATQNRKLAAIQNETRKQNEKRRVERDTD